VRELIYLGMTFIRHLVEYAVFVNYKEARSTLPRRSWRNLRGYYVEVAELIPPMRHKLTRR
jgi:hypothetical protein